MLEFNKVQTKLDSEDLQKFSTELRAELLEMIDSILFISNMVSPKRRYAKDMSKNDGGKIIVDITNPHILEDMDYFRQAAIHYQTHGKYTELYPSANPASEYVRHWKEEARRCRSGHIREYDGEWIPGPYYFYLNYGPILRTVTHKGSKRGARKRGFPDVYDGDYLYYHYVEQARQAGKHCMILKKRGAGFSFKSAVELAKLFVLGDTEEAKTEVTGFAIANEKEFLIKDGVLSKFVDAADWTAKTTPWPRIRDLRNSLHDMHWKMGYKDSERGTEEGTENEVIGVTLKDDPHKARGKRGAFIYWEEIGKFPDVLTSWQIARPSVEEGDFAFGILVGYGTGGEEGSNFKGAEELFYNPTGYNILSLPNVFDRNVMGKQICSFFFPEYMNRLGYYDKNGNSDIIGALIATLEKRLVIKYGSSDPNTLVQEKSERPCTPQESIMRREGSLFPVADLKDYLADISPNMQKFLHPHYVGRLKVGMQGEVEWSNEELHPVLRNYPLKDELDRTGCVELFEMPRRNAQGQVPSGRYIAGCLPPGEKVLTNSGLKNIEDITYSDQLINKDGKFVNIKKLISFDVKEPTYEIKVGTTYRTTKFTGEHPLYTSDSCWKYHNAAVSHRFNLPSKYKKFNFSFNKVRDVKKGQWIKVPNIYKSLKNNFNLDVLWNKDTPINSPLNQEDFWWFIGFWLGDGYCVGKYFITVSINKKERYYIKKYKKIVKQLFGRKVSSRNRGRCVELTFSFQQLNTFLGKYFGKYAAGKKVPEWAKKINDSYKYQLISGYLASDGCITSSTHGGNSYWYAEFVSINLELLEAFQDILFSLGLISSISKLRDECFVFIAGNKKQSKQKKAYHLRMSYYDTIELAKVLYSTDKIKIRKIPKKIINSFKERRFSVDCQFSDNKNYIYFKIKDIKKNIYVGKVYNFECDTNTYLCHHISTHNCDPIDYDSPFGTGSLGSMFMFDLWTDRIVAEYSGRPKLASEFYETCLRMLKFYNAIGNYENNLKGLFAYFDQNRALHYLCDTPEILRDMDYAKGVMFGNKSKGIMVNKAINIWGRKLQADWMVSEAYNPNIENEVKLDEEGNIIEPPRVLNIHKIRSIGYIKEAIAWNEDDNFDRISSMNMVMILRANRLKFEINRSEERMDRIYNDPWFKRSFSIPLKNPKPLQIGMKDGYALTKRNI